MIKEEWLITILCGSLFIYLFIKTSRHSSKRGKPEKSFNCRVISKRDENISINMTNYKNYMIELENDYNSRNEYRAVGKFKYFQYDKIKIGTRGIAFVRDDVIFKFIIEVEEQEQL